VQLRVETVTATQVGSEPWTTTGSCVPWDPVLVCSYGLGVAVLVSVREGLVKGGRMWPSRGRAYVVRLGLLIRITGLPSVMGSTCITASHRSKQVSLLYLLYVKCSERVCFR
jgi:hypothetical protein